jgi:hypothetical protein
VHSLKVEHYRIFNAQSAGFVHCNMIDRHLDTPYMTVQARRTCCFHVRLQHISMFDTCHTNPSSQPLHRRPTITADAAREALCHPRSVSHARHGLICTVVTTFITRLDPFRILSSRHRQVPILQETFARSTEESWQSRSVHRKDGEFELTSYVQS